MKYKKGNYCEFKNNAKEQLWFGYKYLNKVCRIVGILNKKKKLYRVAFKCDDGTTYYTDIAEIFLFVTNKSLVMERKSKLIKIGNEKG